ncbi:MAG: hypothetical protein LBF92_06505 [Synergistaceae bacterium]|nr:hypothetical protein [Synergistaceae bacterium]
MRYELIFVASVLCFMFLGALSPCSAVGGVFRSEIGEFDIYALPERQSEGDGSILIGASPEDIKKYAVPTGGYPSAVNAFAAKAPERTRAMAIQMPRPGVPVAGMHVPYPGIGKVERDPGAPGGCRYAPSGM